MSARDGEWLHVESQTFYVQYPRIQYLGSLIPASLPHIKIKEKKPQTNHYMIVWGMYVIKQQ
nr:MAG TPA: hypothetical protein [Caudoviricetes sp.]